MMVAHRKEGKDEKKTTSTGKEIGRRHVFFLLFYFGAGANECRQNIKKKVEAVVVG